MRGRRVFACVRSYAALLRLIAAFLIAVAVFSGMLFLHHLAASSVAPTPYDLKRYFMDLTPVAWDSLQIPGQCKPPFGTGKVRVVTRDIIPTEVINHFVERSSPDVVVSYLKPVLCGNSTYLVGRFGHSDSLQLELGDFDLTPCLRGELGYPDVCSAEGWLEPVSWRGYWYIVCGAAISMVVLLFLVDLTVSRIREMRERSGGESTFELLLHAFIFDRDDFEWYLSDSIRLVPLFVFYLIWGFIYGWPSASLFSTFLIFIRQNILSLHLREDDHKAWALTVLSAVVLGARPLTLFISGDGAVSILLVLNLLLSKQCPYGTRFNFAVHAALLGGFLLMVVLPVPFYFAYGIIVSWNLESFLALVMLYGYGFLTWFASPGKKEERVASIADAPLVFFENMKLAVPCYLFSFENVYAASFPLFVSLVIPVLLCAIAVSPVGSLIFFVASYLRDRNSFVPRYVSCISSELSGAFEGCGDFDVVLDQDCVAHLMQFLDNLAMNVKVVLGLIRKNTVIVCSGGKTVCCEVWISDAHSDNYTAWLTLPIDFFDGSDYRLSVDGCLVYLDQVKLARFPFDDGNDVIKVSIDPLSTIPDALRMKLDQIRGLQRTAKLLIDPNFISATNPRGLTRGVYNYGNLPRTINSDPGKRLESRGDFRYHSVLMVTATDQLLNMSSYMTTEINDVDAVRKKLKCFKKGSYMSVYEVFDVGIVEFRGYLYGDGENIKLLNYRRMAIYDDITFKAFAVRRIAEHYRKTGITTGPKAWVTSAIQRSEWGKDPSEDVRDIPRNRREFDSTHSGKVDRVVTTARRFRGLKNVFSGWMKFVVRGLSAPRYSRSLSLASPALVPHCALLARAVERDISEVPLLGFAIDPDGTVPPGHEVALFSWSAAEVAGVSLW